MELLLLAGVALLAAGLSFFSGFGVGTLLLPAFALFFPLPLAIAATAVVHLSNNLFKFALTRRHADWGVVWRFGLSAMLAAALGASLLHLLQAAPPWYSYQWGGQTFHVTPINSVIGALILLFAALECWERFQRWALEPRWLPLGGALAGFFGGLSGMQGALRSAFLLKAGLGKEAYIATGVVLALLVDVVRLLVYGQTTLAGVDWAQSDLLLALAVAVLSAAAGTLIGQRLLPKVTLRSVQRGVALLLAAVGCALIAGWV